ncbi:nucleoplasmin-like [Python bivittatus]|uniref:Nucleoplasmin-like n=1 Tax=Python bivittatus TaxID=176946 RepID=A0A9F5MWR7_PYTBI|nr:nucleoplasmin-like [Python bivittatus]
MRSDVALMRPSLFLVPWGCELNDTTPRCVVKEEDDLLEHLVYLRTVILGEDADDETHVLAVESRNMASVPEPVRIVSLRHSVLPMVCLDGFELLPPVSFILKSGTGPVYLNGQHLILEDDSDYEPTEDDIPDDVDADENSFDEGEIPRAEMQAVQQTPLAVQERLGVITSSASSTGMKRWSIYKGCPSLRQIPHST